MVTVREADVQERLQLLADKMTDSGHLRDPEWRRAFVAVRRHIFVPRYWHDDDPGAFPARWRMVDNATRDYSEWLDAVYSDRTLVTDLTGTPAVTGDGMHPQVTSSSTMPSLVMAMLEDLDVTDGMRVLEVGTGTGYNAALLTERLGNDKVFSVDIDPELVALADVRLAAHGYRPHLKAGDGSNGFPQHAPFDRVIATCGMDWIPSAWIEQCRDGGKIMANLRGPFTPYALVLLTISDGTATGKFLHQSGGFMPLRTDPTKPYDYTITIQRGTAETTHRYSQLDPQKAYTDETWGLLAQLLLRGVRCRQVYVDDTENLGTELATGDGTSWAIAHHTPEESGYAIRQGGQRPLWDELEAFHREWDALNCPTYDRFGLSLHKDAKPILWLDHPRSDNTWILPPG